MNFNSNFITNLQSQIKGGKNNSKWKKLSKKSLKLKWLWELHVYGFAMLFVAVAFYSAVCLIALERSVDDRAVGGCRSKKVTICQLDSRGLAECDVKRRFWTGQITGFLQGKMGITFDCFPLIVLPTR